MATDKLNIPVVIPQDSKCNQYDLPATNCVQLKADNRISIQRSIIHLITIPKLRAAHVFRFKEDRTEWKFYEPYHAPLSVSEVRGTMVYAIKQFREPEFLLTKTKIKSHSFIRSNVPIIKYLESLSKEDKVYIILVFENWSYAIGNYFDETSICRALLQYRPRKVGSVIRNMDKDKPILIPKTGNLNRPKTVRIPVF